MDSFSTIKTTLSSSLQSIKTTKNHFMLLTMGFKAKFTLFLFFFFICITTSLALAHHQSEQGDLQREYQQCVQRCQEQQKQQPGQQQQCQQSCERQRQEQEERHEREHRGGRDPQQEYQQCQQRCHQQEPKQQQQCEQCCERQRQEQEKRQREQGGSKSRDPQQEYQQCQRRCQQEPQQQQCQQRCEQQRQEQEERHEREHRGGSRDPQQEYQQCQRQCQQEPRQGQQQQQQCQQRCERQRKEQEERQREQGGSRSRDPQQGYQQCQRQCQQGSRSPTPQQQQQCQQRCEERRQEQERQHQEYQQCQQQCQQQEQGQGQQQQQRCEDKRQLQEQRDNAKEQQQQESNNPYFLDEQSFKDRLRTEHGYTRVSRRFTKISNLLRGIENYRLGLFEANPSTFLIPHHLDADAVFVVVQGRGLINLVHQEDRQTYNLERGDVIRVPAGALIYLINRDNNQKFQIVSLFKPVSTPSNKFREFFGVGGENPESFYNIFSDEILEAAFDTDRKELDSLFRQQRSGEIVQVSQEQIRALSRDASSSQQGSPKWSKHGSQSWRPVNLLNQRPTHSNEYGKLYDVTPNDYPQLQDLDVAVSYHNINKGAMVAPFYNSRATSLIVVINGNNGRFEMACPHLSSSQSQREGREQEQKQGGSVHYQKVSAHLSPRTAFIVPAGHPVSIVASDNQNLEIVAFKINVENNQRNYLAGQNNLLKKLQREAKELAFSKPAREVETILNNQRQSVFLPGPNQRQQREQSEEGRHGGMLIETMADVLAF